MIFKINENESVELIHSFRSALYFEQMTGKQIDFTDFKIQELLYLYYSVVIASLQKAKMPIISMLDFMDAIDDYNGGEQSVLEFSNWYVEVLKQQFNVIDDINANDNKVDNKESKNKESKKKS